MSWRPDVDRSVSTELSRHVTVFPQFYLTIDCALASSPPSAHGVLSIFISRHGTLCALTMCTRGSLLIGRLSLLICTIEWESETNKNLQPVNKSYDKKLLYFDEIRYIYIVIGT